jgi:hypothetical protein
MGREPERGGRREKRRGTADDCLSVYAIRESVRIE